jgi:dipeptidyl aminopeptidase/acylaminoacyl peptidase
MRTRQIHVGHPKTGRIRTLYAHTDSAWVEEYDWVVTDGPILDWSPDARALLFTTESSGFHHLVRVAVDAELARELGDTSSENADAVAERAWPAPEALTSGSWEVAWARWLPNGREIVLLTSREDLSQRHLELLDVESGGLVKLSTATGMNIQPQLGEGGRRVLYEHSRLGLPPDVWVVDAKAGATPRRVTERVPERYRAVDWSIPEIVHFPAHDGTPLRGYLYRPYEFDPNRRYPVVVFVHGAGSMQNVVDGWTIYSPNFKFHSVLTRRGFVVFEVDYRGSLGYGYDFRVGVHRYIGGKDFEDEIAGVDYLKTLSWVDPDRIGIYGGSYGGFMAIMALVRAPDVYAAGAALRFVSDWENYYRGNPWYCIERLGRPEENPAAYYRSSPIHFAENLEDPLLLLHGVRDDNVHFQDAAQLVERLIRLGKDFELMIYPVERHGFTEPESWIDEYARIEEFFVRHLRPDRSDSPGDGVRD